MMLIIKWRDYNERNVDTGSCPHVARRPVRTVIMHEGVRVGLSYLGNDE
jgi:hypothetical protein